MVYPERLYLTGFMGSGKSTVGPILAHALGYGFTDLDARIERRAGRPIPEVFAEEGEAAFRALEAEVLRKAAARPYAVVALGGGALVAPGNRALARATGVVVYLDVPADVLARRLGRAPGGRPLLADEAGRPLAGEALYRRVADLLAERRPLYRAAAHLTVDAGRGAVEQTVEAVREAVRRHAAAQE